MKMMLKLFDLSKTYTDQVKIVIIESATNLSVAAETNAKTYTDSKIEKNICPLITWNENGVGIGTPFFEPYKFVVDGKAIFEEVRIELSEDWTDFVFEPTYNVMPLNQLNTYIQENKNLPEIHTTAEVQENGISIGEMNTKLLQKIEELTLPIQQQELIKALKSDMEAQNKRIEQLENK